MLCAAFFRGGTFFAALLTTFFAAGDFLVGLAFVFFAAVLSPACALWNAAHRFFVAAMIRAFPAALSLRRRFLAGLAGILALELSTAAPGTRVVPGRFNSALISAILASRFKRCR